MERYFDNEILDGLWTRLVTRTEEIVGVPLSNTGIKGIHDVLLSHFNLTRDTEPKTPGDYMKGIAVCSRYHVNRTIDTDSNQTLEEIVTNLEEACTHASLWRGSCTDNGDGTHQAEFHCDDCGASWTESEEHYFLSGSCDYCGASDPDAEWWCTDCANWVTGDRIEHYKEYHPDLDSGEEYWCETCQQYVTGDHSSYAYVCKDCGNLFNEPGWSMSYGESCCPGCYSINYVSH